MPTQAQEKSNEPFSDANFSGLKLRSIGPAFMSGRIADIAIHPTKDNTWYIAIGSGGVWKTVNAGVTWTPIFDKEKVYATGCITIDAKNPSIVWVGTGENVGGRHMSFGDGVYKSTDGGKSWKNMGLKTSEHVSKIIVHPENSDVVWVAAQGPLWSKGGERGVFKTTDGGKTWKQVLGDKEWIGATDLVIDPRNPNQLYAATWQRHRTVAAYMGGGPGSGLHRSNDGGETWEKLSSGLPKSNMGKIGLAISPQKSDVLYAAIELDRTKGGVYRSTDRGSTWKKMSDAVAGATGPHYYQELYACPHNFDRIYLADFRMQVSDDGGKTFRRMKEENKHSDNHALAFRADDPDYLLVGTDGGMYESFDLAENWRFIKNLPLTQFYKVALDDAEPFYNVYGGTQDNSSEVGPSRTDNLHGIQNSDWKVFLNWDGHQPATEPGNPNIAYGQRQQGTLSRIDMITGEVIDIQPQPTKGEPYERFNWDAPILVSPHSPTTIYFASQRLWKSDNRGDSWTALSKDLTRNENRFTLPIMGKQQSWDEPWDVGAMSNYNTITSIAESPKKADLIYIGTDDGIIQITEDGGENWKKIELSSISGVPATCYVNDIKADLHDENTVYACLDNHKYGDYKPYLIKSTDKGNTWTSIAANIPDHHLVWRIVQDHKRPALLFIGTEFGLFFTIDGGKKWTELNGGIPTISFRDLAIQRRENDLVAASFGRGFYIFDDYSVLQEVDEEKLKSEASLFSTRKAWWYIPRSHLGFEGKRGDQGADHYVADNPLYGAVFTYYLKDGYLSKTDTRKKEEKDLRKNDKNIPFPGWDALEAERNELKPMVWLIVKDSEGNVIRRVKGAAKKGFHRIAWDLRYPSPMAITSNSGGEPMPGLFATPGTYTVTLAKQIDGVITELSSPQPFEVVPLRKGALEGATPQKAAEFWRDYETTVRAASALQISMTKTATNVQGLMKSLTNSQAAVGDLDKQLVELRSELLTLDSQMNGNRATQEPGEKVDPTISSRLFDINRGLSNSTYGPTATHTQVMGIIQSELNDMSGKLGEISKKMETVYASMLKAGAPVVEGMTTPR